MVLWKMGNPCDLQSVLLNESELEVELHWYYKKIWRITAFYALPIAFQFCLNFEPSLATLSVLENKHHTYDEASTGSDECSDGGKCPQPPGIYYVTNPFFPLAPPNYPENYSVPLLPVDMVMACSPTSEPITAMQTVLDAPLKKNKWLRVSEWCWNGAQTWSWNGILGEAAAISTIITTVLVIAGK
ncbi:hypothetical protein DL93DRAFT_2101754 [Clavulina sp. PMI_390]|nr:hypothetical protein DL93DRAFT_2101754 [Clavulina sp. PMI_390]